MAAPLTRRLTRQRNQGAIGRAGVPTTTQENDMATSNQGGDKNKQGSGQGANQGSNQGSSQGSKQSDTSKRGFASMDPDQQREIASEGGRAAHEKGTAHEFTSEEARRAGSMSHKNDTGSSQSGAATSRSGSGGGNQGSAGQQGLGDDMDTRGSKSGGAGGAVGSGSGSTGSGSGGTGRPGSNT